MADSKISGLAAVAAFAATQEFAVNDSGTSRKISGTQLQAAFPQGTLSGGYASATANQGSITTLVDLTGLTITVTPGSGRRILIMAYAAFQSTVLDDYVNLHIVDTSGPTDIGSPIWCMGLANDQVQGVGYAVFIGTGAAKTFKLQASRIVGSGTLTLEATSTNPAFILAQDIGV